MPQLNLPSKFRLPSQTVREGGCLCGAIPYKVTGPVTVVRGSCHCRPCRKASSAPEPPYAQFALSHFDHAWLAGAIPFLG